MSNCGCNNRMLSDEADIKILEELYKLKSDAGGLSFMEWLTNKI